MGCFKQIAVLVLAFVVYAAAEDEGGIDCYACVDSTCDTACNLEPVQWCNNQQACLIEVTADPSYKTEYISKRCNDSCNPHSLNKFQCNDDYCYDRVYCCTTKLCNAVTPKRPIPKAPDAPVGPKGYVGPPGPPGLPGGPGSKGDGGNDGPVGPVGPKGPNGDVGDKGDPGLPGLGGPPGPNGMVGPKGLEGPPGPQGPPGFYGHQGPDGEKGARGETGPGGPVGFPGLSGASGPRGQKGCKGEEGRGPKGDKGDIGWPGGPGNEINGDDGNKGDPGPDGFRGATGEDGDDGTCTCDIAIEHICFSVWQDFVFNLPPFAEPQPLIIEGFFTYVNTFGDTFGFVGFFNQVFTAPVTGLYLFSIVSVSSCNFATAVELRFGSPPPDSSVVVIITGRSVANAGQEIAISLATVVICLQEGETVFTSAESPALPAFDDPEDPWENNSPSFITFTGCLHTAGICPDPPTVNP